MYFNFLSVCAMYAYENFTGKLLLKSCVRIMCTNVPNISKWHFGILAQCESVSVAILDEHL